MSRLIKVKVTPCAKKNRILGWQGDALRVHLIAPPVAGKANIALVDFLADEWSLSKSNIKIIHGQTNRNKVLEIPDSVFLSLQNRLI